MDRKTVLFVWMGWVVMVLLACQQTNVSNPCCTSEAINVVFDSGFVSIPNAFTPDDNAINEEFFIHHEGIESMNVRVVQSGKQVYFSTDPDFRWNGFYQGRRLDYGEFQTYFSLTTVTGQQLIFQPKICMSDLTGGAVTGQMYCLQDLGPCEFSDQWDSTGFNSATLERVTEDCQ